MKVLILAGGNGTRLWPLSTEKMPKQFLELSSDGSLIQKTLRRALCLAEPRDIVIVTAEKHFEMTQEHIDGVCSDAGVQIACEPVGKNTAAAIALGIVKLEDELPLSSDDLILVLSADHEIFPEAKLVDSIHQAEMTARSGGLVCFGAEPRYPETGYGYLKIDEPDSSEATCHRCSFVEKPNLEKAKAFLQEGGYLWNCGMFLFSYSAICYAFKKHLPNIYPIFSMGYSGAYKNFDSFTSISIDYGIMEKSKDVFAAKLEGISWSDIGTYDALYSATRGDQDGNVCYGDVHLMEAKNCFVQSTSRPVALLGVSNLHIIETPEAILVATHGQSQKVKEVASSIELKEPDCKTLKHVLEPDECKTFKGIEKSLYLLVVSGLAEVTLGEKSEKLTMGQTFYVQPGQSVELSNQSHHTLELIEVSVSAQRPLSIGAL